MNFNSIKVRLEPEDCEDTSYSLSYFNSIKVRLELSAPKDRETESVYFNSIKVRLEHGYLRKIACGQYISIP